MLSESRRDELWSEGIGLSVSRRFANLLLEIPAEKHQEFLVFKVGERVVAQELVEALRHHQVDQAKLASVSPVAFFGGQDAFDNTESADGSSDDFAQLDLIGGPAEMISTLPAGGGQKKRIFLEQVDDLLEIALRLSAFLRNLICCCRCAPAFQAGDGEHAMESVTGPG